ncbi:hypothetical protein V6N13_042484 [Hibiscus sabdariffa]
MGFLSLRQRYGTPFIGDTTSTATTVHKRGHEQRLPTTLFKTQVSSMGEEGTNMPAVGCIKPTVLARCGSSLARTWLYWQSCWNMERGLMWG